MPGSVLACRPEAGRAWFSIYFSALLTKALVTAPTSTQQASRRSGHVTTLTNVANVTAYLVVLFTSTCPSRLVVTLLITPTCAQLVRRQITRLCGGAFLFPNRLVEGFVRQD
jgi:hypothetical protein